MDRRKLGSGVIALVYLGQVLSAPQAQTETPLARARSLAVALSINSSVPAARVLQAMLGDDFKEVQSFLNGEKIDLNSAVMSDAPVADGRIFFQDKVADIREDLSIRVDGQVLKYDRTQSPAQNYIRFFKAFAGKTKSDYSTRVLHTLVPEAAAAGSSNDTYGGATVISSGNDVIDVMAYGLVGYGAGTVIERGFRDLRNGRADRAMVRGMSKAGAAAEAARKAAEEAAKTGITPEAAAAAKTADATKAAEAAKVGKVQLAREWARTQWKSLAAKMPKGGVTASLRTAGQAVAGVAAAHALLIAGGAALLGAAVIGGKAWYTSLMHGVFKCGPEDAEGKKTYVFNFTNTESEWYWKTTDQRAFTAGDVSALLLPVKEVCLAEAAKNTDGASSIARCDSPEVIPGCDETHAAFLTQKVRSLGDQLIAEIGASKAPAKSDTVK